MTSSDNKFSNKQFSPSQFMRNRRPYLYSDSKKLSNPVFTKEMFNLVLEKITAEKKEYEFEHFCRRLAQKEICPNLIPQTGPTGGGDSKVDTETYPVADTISEIWYESNMVNPSKSKWAFAFSAKEKYKGKIESDVRKIAETKRGYALIYFISSRYIKDKQRAELEDSLTKENNIEVKILDRSWIIDVVFSHDRIRLAIDTLNLSEIGEKSSIEIGVNDAERLKEINDIETRLKEASHYTGIRYQMIDDSLESALLSRGLEHPRAEIDGKFQRTIRLAKKYGSNRKLLKVLYNRAWTENFWFEDFDCFNDSYIEIQKLVIGTDYLSDVEKLSNLYSILFLAQKMGHLNINDSEINERFQILKNEVDKFIANIERPNACLHAQAILLSLNLVRNVGVVDEVNKCISEFSILFDKIEGMSEFPAESYISILQELGMTIPENRNFDNLIEKISEVESKRKHNLSSGQILFKRGQQKLAAKHSFDAIRYFGKSQSKLALEESKRDFFISMASCSNAYEHIELLWAARANLLFALNIAIKPFHEDGVLNPHAYLCVKHLVWLELKLGRVFDALEWIELQNMLVANLHFNDNQLNTFKEEFQLQDAVLGILLLKSNLTDLSEHHQLPTVLLNLGLLSSFVAIMYALGYTDWLMTEGYIPEGEDHESILRYFEKWINQPAAKGIPKQPKYYLGDYIDLTSSILGCKIQITAHNDKSSRSIAESILYSLESFLATSAIKGVFPFRENYRIKVQKSDEGDKLSFKVEENNSTNITVCHSDDYIFGTQEQREKNREFIQKIVFTVIPQIVVIPEFEIYITNLIKDESILERSFNFLNHDVAIYNVLGKSPKRHISDWITDGYFKSYTLLRKTEWYKDLSSKQSTSNENESSNANYAQSHEGYKSEQNPKVHKNRIISGIIKPEIWNYAGWKGIGYAISEGMVPPMFSIVFKNIGKGKEIFTDWIEKYGKVDKNDEIKVSIITGISFKHPTHYRVVIGGDIKDSTIKEPSEILIMNRIHTMTPSNDININNFMKLYSSIGAYYLTPAEMTSDSTLPILFTEVCILKNKIHVIEAYKIDENNLLSTALDGSENVLIPSGVTDPPIIKTLERINSRK